MPERFTLIVPSGAVSADAPFRFGVGEAIAALSVEADPDGIEGKTTFSLSGPGVDARTEEGDLSSLKPTFDFASDPQLQADPARYLLDVTLEQPAGAEVTITGKILFEGDLSVSPFGVLVSVLKVKRLYAPKGRAIAALSSSGEPLALGLFTEKAADAEAGRNLMIGQASAGGAAFAIQQVLGPDKRPILELSATGDADIDAKPVKPIARAGSHYTPVLHACGPFQLGRFCESYDLACADRGDWAYISNPAIQAIEALPACIATGRPVTRVDHD